MCFSATASFLTAGVTATAGIYCLARTKDIRELPFAAVPLLFATQQTVEGLMWPELAATGTVCAPTSMTYLLFANIVWPVYIPTAILLAEPDPRRKRVMQPCLLLGACAAVYALGWIFAARAPLLEDAHIVYPGDPQQILLVKTAYVLAVVIALTSSSRAAARALGGIAFIGFLISYLLYNEAFVSVWCFFAAYGSIVVAWRSRTSEARTTPSSRLYEKVVP